MSDQIRIRYNGTNIGKIYLSDVEKRLALGGSVEGNYRGGQDQYIIWGETVVLQKSGNVLMSLASGNLKYYSTANASIYPTGAPLTIDSDAIYTSVDEVPLRDVEGDTGRYTDEYMSRLANDKYAPTNVAGATGYYYGNK